MRCGEGVMADCSPGSCCSAHNWCGSSPDHCQCEGCTQFDPDGERIVKDFQWRWIFVGSINKLDRYESQKDLLSKVKKSGILFLMLNMHRVVVVIVRSAFIHQFFLFLLSFRISSSALLSSYSSLSNVSMTEIKKECFHVPDSRGLTLAFWPKKLLKMAILWDVRFWKAKRGEAMKW